VGWFWTVNNGTAEQNSLQFHQFCPLLNPTNQHTPAMYACNGKVEGGLEGLPFCSSVGLHEVQFGNRQS
jgi:hypothetical protein